MYAPDTVLSRNSSESQLFCHFQIFSTEISSSLLSLFHLKMNEIFINNLDHLYLFSINAINIYKVKLILIINLFKDFFLLYGKIHRRAGIFLYLMQVHIYMYACICVYIRVIVQDIYLIVTWCHICNNARWLACEYKSKKIHFLCHIYI